MADQESAPPSTPAATAAIAQTRDVADAAGGGGLKPPGGEAGAFTLGPRVDGKRAGRSASYQRKAADPLYRPLRIYTVDPARGRLEGAITTINVPYEPLKPGPTGARFKVIGSGGIEDVLPSYGEVDLEDRRVLIRSGHDPAPCDPLFHHQMAYAVASTAYAAFRHALGREIDWSFDDPRLELHVHAFAGSQALYTPSPIAPSRSGTVKFGYFQAGSNVRGRVPPGGTVYLCLSHDVIAHEVTHALVSGLRTKFNREFVSHIDVDAFHEAFADLVALLLRFSYAEVVREAIRDKEGLFWTHESFPNFGIQAAHGDGKNALRTVNLFEEAKRYDPKSEVYALGTVLVSAIVEALIIVYKRKAAPYLRLASGGTGVFAPGARLPADLVDVLTHTASRLASQFLTVCVRALDYCPPAGLDFGEYLRALVTADFELVPDDQWGYREALIDAFSQRGIYPRRVPSMSEDALRWRGPRLTIPPIPQLSFAALRFAGDPASPLSPRELKRRATALGRLVTRPDYLDEFGLMAEGDPALGADSVEPPQVESVRSARRVGPDGQIIFDLVCEVTQCRKVLKPDGKTMDYTGGSTIIIDPGGAIRYILRKAVSAADQIERKLEFEASEKTAPKQEVIEVDINAPG